MALHLRGAILPDGQIRQMWLLGDRVTFERPAGEHDTICGWGWILPGLVDAHTHPGHRKDGTFAEDLFHAQCRECVTAGVSAVRVPGSARRLSKALCAGPDLPRITAAGRWLVWSGLAAAEAPGHRVVDDLVGCAVAEAQASSGWCKLVGDWEPFAPGVPQELLTAVVAAVHAVGGKVAVHCQTAAGCRAAVLAGADSLEHGMHLDPGLLDRMRQQGTALVPTLAAFAKDLARVRAKPPGPRRDWYLDGFSGLLATTRAAHEAGVAVYAGTDAVGPVRFGDVASEVEWLVRAGIPPADAVAAASWQGRRWLGLPGLTEGALADLVVYDTDPRLDVSALRRPRRIVLRGQLVR